MSEANDASKQQDSNLQPATRLPGESRKDCWERLRREGRAQGLNKHEAYDRANRETARLWGQADAATNQPQRGGDAETTGTGMGNAENGVGDAVQPTFDAGSTRFTGAGATEAAVIGLGDIPASWPKLPPNASLAAEIQWVQSSRIDVVEELPSGVVRVHLDRADRPAPSKSALGWLETSIKAYTKFVDVAAKATAAIDDEKAHERRERLAIEEVRSLLAEMLVEDA